MLSFNFFQGFLRLNAAALNFMNPIAINNGRFNRVGMPELLGWQQPPQGMMLMQNPFQPQPAHMIGGVQPPLPPPPPAHPQQPIPQPPFQPFPEGFDGYYPGRWDRDLY